MKKLMVLTMVFGLMMVLAGNGNAQIKIGSYVNLENQYDENGRAPKTWLDTRGRVVDKQKDFPGINETWFVSTSANRDRDAAGKGSGSWQIISTSNKQGNLNYGDEIYLLNGYPGNCYLDVWDKENNEHIEKTSNDGTDNPVFANTNKNRNNGSGTWKVVNPANPNDKSEVKIGSAIMLESKFKGLMPGHFLEVNGRVASSPSFKEYAGSVYGVFVSDQKGFHGNSEKWKITLDK
jgi:hypothetical protein